jgi:glycogen synthase
MIEAMACGTPVIAFRRGSIPEIVDESLTGFVVRNIDEAVAAVSRAAALSRYRVRERFEKRFSVERMTRGYVSIYNRMLEKSAVARRVAVFPTRPFAGKPWMAQARPASDNEVSPSDGNY